MLDNIRNLIFYPTTSEANLKCFYLVEPSRLTKDFLTSEQCAFQYKNKDVEINANLVM